MKPKLILWLVFVWSVAQVHLRAAGTFEFSTNLHGLVLHLHGPDQVLKLGDEIPIEFVISNAGTASYDYFDQGYDPSGRLFEYQLQVKADDGQVMPDPRAKYPAGSGGIGSGEELRPRKSFTKTVPLNLWATLPRPGQYTVTGIYHGNFPIAEGVKSDPITITVLPRTDAEMNAYIGGLTNQLAGTGGRDSRQRDLLLRKLAFTGSPEIVPFMLKEMYASDDNFWAAMALAVYVPHSDATRREIVGMALQHGLAGEMDDVLRQYGCTAEEHQTILQRSLAEATTHLAGSDMAEIYHLDVENPRAEDRARLASDFPKFSTQNQFLVLTRLWPQARCPEFAGTLLPLAQPPKEPEQPGEEAVCEEVFIRLFELKPAAVRPLILEDMRRPKPLLALSVLQLLPDQELPELDEALRANLNNPNSDFWKVLPLIERYATTNLMPQVIAYYQNSREQGWACSLQTAMLRYWLKHDRPAALRAIEKAVNFRKATGCYHTVLGDTLRDSFAADAEKLARKYARDSDPEVAADARQLLAQHGLTSPGNPP